MRFVILTLFFFCWALSLLHCWALSLLHCWALSLLHEVV